MSQDVGEALEDARLELLRRASTYVDLQAWAAFQQSPEEIVLTWFHNHPGSDAACRLQRERHFVALAFERLRQAVVQGQVAVETLSEVLVYLRTSLNGVILKTLRVSSCPVGISEYSSADRSIEGTLESHKVWDWLEAHLSSEREKRAAYLLYHCGLSPIEIVKCCPQEWSNVHEVTRLRCLIFMQLTRET
jgi:hypothetical protein